MVGHARNASEPEAAVQGERQDYFQRMGQVVMEVVENHVTEPPAYKHAYEPVGQDVLEEFLVIGEARFRARAAAGNEKDHGEGHDVHEAVPLDAQGSQVEQDRVHFLGQMLPEVGEIAHGAASGKGKV